MMPSSTMAVTSSSKAMLESANSLDLGEPKPIGKSGSDGRGRLIGPDHPAPYLTNVRLGHCRGSGGDRVPAEIIDLLTVTLTAIKAAFFERPVSLAEITSRVKEIGYNGGRGVAKGNGGG
jgi:hypothetical protein